MPQQRPFMLTLMAILSTIAGLLLLVGGIGLVGGDPRLIYDADAAVGVGINYLIAAGIDLVIAVGLWQLWTPIRSFTIGYAAVNLVVIVPLLLLDTSTVPLVVQGIVQGVMIVMFLDLGIRAAFDPIAPPIPSENTNTLE